MERLTEMNENKTAHFYPQCFEKCEGIGYNRKCDSCDLLNRVCDKLGEYEDLEEQEKLLKLPCAVGDTVYVLAECESIPKQIDGTLWDSNGGMGTATGYYCPYENNCPFENDDFEGCDKYKKQTAVFEDTVKSITIEENAVYILTEDCGVYSEIGRFVFLTQEEAEATLKVVAE